MTTEIKDTVLNIEIQNNSPLELIELTKSLIALSNQYNSHSIENGFTESERTAKLYVKKIVTGSVLLDLVEYGSASVIPFVESSNTLITFATSLKTSIDYFLKGKGEKPNLNIQDCKEISRIVSPVAKDNSSQLNVNVTVNGNVNNYVSINSSDSLELQSLLKQEIKKQQELVNGDIIENAIMIFSTLKNKINTKGGNKAIIDDAMPNKAINVIIPDKKLKKKIIKGEENPNNFSFQVDVKIKTANNIIVAYEILKLHDKFPLEDN